MTEDAAEEALEVALEEIKDIEDERHKIGVEIGITALPTGIVLIIVEIVRF